MARRSARTRALRNRAEADAAVAEPRNETGTAERAADFIAAYGFADVVHHDQRCVRSLAQSQQALAESGHSARIVFVLVVRGIERVQNNDLGGRRPGSRQKVLQSL